MYYEHRASQFFTETANLDLSALYSIFLWDIPAGGHILDAGCGSGRDSVAFNKRGYRVTAFDASPTLAARASEHCNLPVQVLKLQDVAWQKEFDGIWACASLLHVSLIELPNVFDRLASALAPSGVLYASFKYGSGEREHNERRFTDMNKSNLEALLVASTLTISETWITADSRPKRQDERWLNSLMRLT
jgi:SAM-dependent methyltransferase